MVQRLSLTQLFPGPVKTSSGLYIHIPFCKQACHYCSFHFSTRRQLQAEMIACIGQEIYLRRHYLEAVPISSIYFGGGTPSLLAFTEIDHLLTQVFRYCAVATVAEITLEANPDDLTLEKLRGLHQLGINRLSIGVQSFNDKVLQYMHRAHNSAMAQKSIEWARSAQFSNLSIDLIYAIPGTTTEDWQRDLAQALLLEPEHISAYYLAIEPKTVWEYQRKKGNLLPISEAIAAEQFAWTIETCQQQGYFQYEIANFGRPGKFSRHNINYWRSRPYLGVGPAAHSYKGWYRQANIAHNIKYMQAIQQGHLPYTEERLSVANRVNEHIMTTIRTCWGCDLDWIARQYGVSLLAIHKDYITSIVQEGLAHYVDHKLYLTNRGKRFATKIAGDLFILDTAEANA
ncbi:MAG: radical SAM family heme chaperone HemW [Candidatus Cardinium sp.]|nr:radical SAM family heme chaperone HemW [Candidatus Cardinium sp.]